MKYVITLYLRTDKYYYKYIGDGLDYVTINTTADPAKATFFDTKNEALDFAKLLAKDYASLNIPVAIGVEDFTPKTDTVQKYTFLAVYTQLQNEGDTMRLAQDLVLEEWRSHLEHKKVPYIPDAKISFKTYSFSKYPYQELLKNWVWKKFTNSFGDLCAFGTVYTDIDELIADLDVEKKLIELTVEVEE
jgi:hypothetical protein